MAGILKVAAQKIAYHAAVAFSGYKIGDYLEKESVQPVIVKPEVIIPPQKEEGVSAHQITYVLTVIVLVAFLFVSIKYVVKRLTSANRRNTEIIPMYQCNYNSQKAQARAKASRSKNQESVEDSA